MFSGKHIQPREKNCVFLGYEGSTKVVRISYMRTQILPHCVCKCDVCSCSLPCRRLLTPSMGLSYHVLFGNPSRFYGNRRAVRGTETGGKRDAQRAFGTHGAWMPAHPWMPAPKCLECPKPRGWLLHPMVFCP